VTALFHVAQGSIILALLSAHWLAFCALRTFILAEGGYLGVARWRRRTGRAATVCAWSIGVAAAMACAGLIAHATGS